MRAASVTALAVGLGACPESRSAVRFALHTEPRWKPDPRFQAVSPRAPGPDLARDTASVHFLDRPLTHAVKRGGKPRLDAGNGRVAVSLEAEPLHLDRH